MDGGTGDVEAPDDRLMAKRMGISMFWNVLEIKTLVWLRF